MRSSNRVWLSVGLFLAAFFLFSTAAFAKQLKTFEDPRSKYTLKYPEDYWVKISGRVTLFVSPNTDKKTGFSDSVNITVGILADPAVKLDDFFDQAKKNLAQTVNKVNILDEKKDKLSGADAYRIVFTSQQKKEIFKLVQVVSIHKGKAFVVTYTALAGQFDRSLSQANAIIKSLKFTD